MKQILYLFLIFSYSLFGQNTQNTISAGMSGGESPDSSCVVQITRTNLIALRNAVSLEKGCHYLVTDHVQGRLVAGTQIMLHAISANMLSESAIVLTTYDNEAWTGIYDLDRGLVLELKDNRNNIARGFNGNEVSNFDWGNTAYSSNLVDNSTLTVTYGSTVQVYGNKIVNATLNLTGFTGQFYWNRVHTAANWNLTNANGTWRYNEVKNGGNLNMLGYLGGGDNYYNEFDGCSFNFTGQTGACGFRQNEVLSSSWTISGAGTCTITNNNFVQQSISRLTGTGNITLNLCSSRESGSINITGTGALSMKCVQNNGSIQIQSTGNLTITYSRLEQSSVFRNSGTAQMTITRTVSDGANSSIYTDAGSSTIVSVTDCIIESSGLIRVVGAVGGGNFTVNSTRVASASYIYKRHTGSLTITQSELTGSSGIDMQSGTRNYTLTRITMGEVSRFTGTGTGTATDVFNEVVLTYRGAITVSCSGLANTVNYVTVNGLNGSMVISGTSGSKTINRIKLFDGSLTISNNSNAATFVLFTISDLGSVTIQSQPSGTTIQYVDVSNGSSMTINKTGAGNIQYVTIRNNATANITAGALAITKLDVEQGVFNCSGGTINNVSKKMQSTFTVTGGTQTNVSHWTTTSKTTAVTNTSRADYLGLTSTVPIL